ncbi:hypothetical protein GALL_40510 [mine drainage metagenome]|uniref:Uncharacterized protein n=1 Tax=mine drainage metagenome TaxID=410659 RepID=A0A1J5T2C0_9ZZZZ
MKSAVIRDSNFTLVTEFAQPDVKRRIYLGEALVGSTAFNIYGNALGSWSSCLWRADARTSLLCSTPRRIRSSTACGKSIGSWLPIASQTLGAISIDSSMIARASLIFA